MTASWLGQPEYSHAILIPVIAAFLLWQRRPQLSAVTFSGSWAGVVIVLLGAAMNIVGQLATLLVVQQYALIVMIYGVVLALTGNKAFRIMLLPLAILLLMVPLPQFLLASLSARMQLLSSELGVAVIRLFGISVNLEGNVIDLGSYQLQVAEACDGLRYLFPLMTLGFLMASFYRSEMWKRIVLFLSSVPITIVMNSFRIGIIGITVEHWGVRMAEGFLHEFQGWAVFMASTALMLFEVMLLSRLGPHPRHWRELFAIE